MNTADELNALKLKDYKKITLDNIGLDNREMLIEIFGTPDRCKHILDLVNKHFDRVSPDQYGIKIETIYTKQNGKYVAMGVTNRGELLSLKELIKANGVERRSTKSVRCFIRTPIDMLIWADSKVVKSRN